MLQEKENRSTITDMCRSEHVTTFYKSWSNSHTEPRECQGFVVI